MAVRSSVTHKRDVPHEEGQWIEFKELGWRSFEAAREVRARQGLMNFRELGPEFLKGAQASPADEETSTKKAEFKDTYDMGMILRASIIAWSYEAECSEANIDELDQKTAEWALTVIEEIHFPTEAEMGKVIEP